MNIIPKDITLCKETGLHTASFSYYDGIHYAKEHNIEQTTDFSEVRNNNKFIVCCGDVMVKVNPEQFPDVKRRLF